MITTLFLASIWGPLILAVGVGVFVSRNYYMRIYRELEKDALSVLTFGMVAMAAGIIQVSMHNVWGSLPDVIVSLLGWGLLIKGAAFIIAPKLVDMGGDWAADSKLVPTVGGFMLLIGAYLTWISYFA